MASPVLVVEPSRTRDIHDMLDAGLRPADMRELDALRVEPFTALIRGLSTSDRCMTVVVDGYAAAMFGVAPAKVGLGIGHPWLLGTSRLDTIRIPFIRRAPGILLEISKGYRLLANCVHEDNELHIRWLRSLDFTFLGRRGPFIEFLRFVHV